MSADAGRPDEPGGPDESGPRGGPGRPDEQPASVFPLPEPPSASTAEPPPAAPGAPVEGYQPLGGRARRVRVALAAVAIVDIVAMISGVLQLRLLQRAQTEEISEEAASTNDLLYGGVGLVQVAAVVVTAVLFIRWFHRAYRNLGVLGGLPRYGAGWAIGGWFVPILNLWRPKQIANDIWRGTDPELPPGGAPARKGGQLPALFALWWGGWVISNLIDNVAFRLTLRAEELPELISSTQVNLLADGFEIPLALVAALVVSRTTGRQDERAAQLGAHGATSAGRGGAPGATHLGGAAVPSGGGASGS